MTRCISLAAVLVPAVLFVAQHAIGQEGVAGLVGSVVLPTGPEEPAKGRADAEVAGGAAKVEFFWLESQPIEGLTQAKGFQISCDPDDLAYAHLKPVLTSRDVAGTKMTNSDFKVNGLPGDHFMINFELTKEAREALIAGCGDLPAKSLAVFADGKYWGLSYFRKAEADKFSPHAGFISSRITAERIVKACQPAAAR